MSHETEKSGHGTRETADQATGEAEALAGELARNLGIGWRPGQDVAVLLRALEERGGPVPEAVMAVMGAALDAAEALEDGLDRARKG